MTTRMPARERIGSLVDRRSFRERSRSLVSVDPLRFTDQQSYRDRLAAARRRTGLREAAVVGAARIHGHPVILIILDFDFMGGTMGSVVGEKVAEAFEFAAHRKVPVVSVVASGGARMQEGMLSLMQMAKTAAARSAHDRAGLAYISVLTDPTFGGVAASFASLGDIIIAEPRAQIGFVGPRVIELTLGEPVPPGSHTAEALLTAGMIDLIVSPPALRDTLGYLLSHLRTPAAARARRWSNAGPSAPERPLSSWQEVQLARHAGRPTAADYIDRLFRRFVEIHGDRVDGDDPAIICGFGEFEGEPVMVVAQERGRTPEEQQIRRGGRALPEGYRKALRVMRLAAKFRIPIITLIDTPGAYPGVDAERRGIAQVLATSLEAMAALPAPIVSVVIGEGGSGGALALGVADRVMMLEHAIYSVIGPEAAAAILWRDTARAPEVAEGLKITAFDLARLGIIDRIVPEPPGGAHLDHDLAASHLGAAVSTALRELRRLSPPVLLRRRYAKYRHIGRVGIYWREVVRTEMQDLLDAMDRVMRRRDVKAEPAHPD